MDKGQKDALLRNLRGGHDVQEAAQMASVPMAELNKAGPTLRRQVDDAYRLATAKLRSKLLKGALEGDGDLRLLAGVLEHREAAQTASAAEDKIDTITIKIVDARCPHCGQQPYANSAARGLPGDAPEPEPADEPEPAKPAKPAYERKYRSFTPMGGL